MTDSNKSQSRSNDKDNDEDTADNVHDTGKHMMLLKNSLSQMFGFTAGEAIALNPKNLSGVLHSNDLVLILFYSEQCRYSMQFMPVFDAAADQLRAEFGDNGKVSLAKLDCAAYSNLEDRFNIGKYPTIRIFRFGRVGKIEYRGERTLDALIQFIHKELRDPIEEFCSMSDLQQQKNQKNLVLGYFESSNHLEYEVFRKTSLALRDYHCRFYASFGDSAKSLNPSGRNKIVFQKNLALAEEEDLSSDYNGSMSGFSEMYKWIHDKCKPIFRELTFDNAEEISEEGRPWVILFHQQSDVKSGHELEKVIQMELMDELDKVNFVSVDATTFDFLFDIDRTEEELPVIFIDSVVHMYEFPKFEDIYIPGKLKQFIRDLYTGQLHISHHVEEFLAGESDEEDDNHNQIKPTKIEVSTLAMQEEATTVKTRHKSKLKDYLPSRNRYTMRDEL
ncbi:endoplasmic reticulum resident protein 44 [Drosophila nasuta]|uniref:endoplasmic reticulum resident protein 44 n=1 Tax=Drosophila nasuta TaxID=42062 RepID=UPI00295EAB6A|nr:endoplasmic reticulum resident protein 44 [Drosophila nasuta]